MRSTPKNAMLSVLTEGMELAEEIPISQARTCYLIDGHALVQALGEPPNCQTFDEYGKVYTKSVFRHFSETTSRIDVVFDRYQTTSIKSGTREKRAGKIKPIRKVINRGDLRFPKQWNSFIASTENKEDLANFLSQKLVEHGKAGQEVVVGGIEEGALSSVRGQVVNLKANHEEADTRLILHALEAISCGYERIVVQCRDTDVLLLLLFFLGDQSADVWMKSGTSKSTKLYHINAIAQTFPRNVISNILGFHSLTGCDTVSSFAGNGKKTCWQVYVQHPELLHGVGRDGAIADIEQFVCRVYKTPSFTKGCDTARLEVFQKGKKALEMLPPTTDALELHLKRANFQTKVWLQADKTEMELPTPASTGAWKENDDGQLQVVWIRKPSVPQSCQALISCGCKTQCRTSACGCNGSKQGCMPVCACYENGCLNPHSI